MLLAHQLLTILGGRPANPLFTYAPRRTRTFNLGDKGKRRNDETRHLCGVAAGFGVPMHTETRPNILKVAHQMLTESTEGARPSCPRSTSFRGVE